MRLPSLHIRDLAQRCAVIEGRQPKPRPAGFVGRFHHNLAAIRRGVEIEDRKTSHQGFRAPRLQVGHHHFSKVPVKGEFVGLLPHDAVQELAAIGREGRSRCVSLERDLPVAARVVKPQGSALQRDGGDERAAIRRHGDAFLFGWASGDLLRIAIRKTLPPDVICAHRVRCEVHPLPIPRPRGECTTSSRRTDLVS